MDTPSTEFEGWAIVELMGHRRLAGMVSTVELFGGSFLRLDIPAPNGDGFTMTQYYGAAAIYCITPTSEEIARSIAAHNQPAPVNRWELPAPAADHVTRLHDDDVDPDEDICG